MKKVFFPVFTFCMLIFLLAGCKGSRILVIPDESKLLDRGDINSSYSFLSGNWTGKYDEYKIDMAVTYVQNQPFFINTVVHEKSKSEPVIPMCAKIYDINGNKYAICFPHIEKIIEKGKFNGWGLSMLYPLIAIMKINVYDENKISFQEVIFIKDKSIRNLDKSKDQKHRMLYVHSKEMFDYVRKGKFKLEKETIFTRKADKKPVNEKP